ncbi:MAG: benzoyl-CoA 2,3-epoxidase subunit BoxA [Deltaproteobacteria bacterium]|nr:benzoyl-CoA 2,3-epoxidase subunit BoxA [Deltaproteobacteria bacterium]
MSLQRQHLIDPAICIRCNTCEEMCPIDAITHNDLNYVVKFDVCESCLQCIATCPTGAIDSWRDVAKPWSIEEQMTWDDLPDDQQGDVGGEGIDGEVSSMLEKAEAGQAGQALAPFSAAQPSVNLFARGNPVIARVAGNFRITDTDTESDIRHVVLDLGSTSFPVLEGQCIGIISPGVDENGNPHHQRLYSISSPRDGERPNRNNLALTIKRVAETNLKGVGSNFMCDLKKGDEVQVTGPFGQTFLMPNHPEANIIMIATGTGAAPMRAMTMRRQRVHPHAPGKLVLYLGSRTPGDLPYFGPLQKLPRDFIDVNLCFSRLDGQPREYVQDRMQKDGEKLSKLLESDDTFVYICGLKGMEKGVDEAFAGICAAHGLDWPTLAAKMKETGRDHIETY